MDSVWIVSRLFIHLAISTEIRIDWFMLYSGRVLSASGDDAHMNAITSHSDESNISSVK